MAAKFYILNLIILSVLLISSGGCKKSKENKIEGTWQMINVWDPGSEKKEQWYFEKVSGDEGNLYWTTVKNGSSTSHDNGKYSIEAKLFSSYVNIEYGQSSHGLSGKWEIAKLKKDILILIQEDGGLLTREFEKID